MIHTIAERHDGDSSTHDISIFTWPWLIHKNYAFSIRTRVDTTSIDTRHHQRFLEMHLRSWCTGPHRRTNLHSKEWEKLMWSIEPHLRKQSTSIGGTWNEMRMSNVSLLKKRLRPLRTHPWAAPPSHRSSLWQSRSSSSGPRNPTNQKCRRHRKSSEWCHKENSEKSEIPKTLKFVATDSNASILRKNHTSVEGVTPSNECMVSKVTRG